MSSRIFSILFLLSAVSLQAGELTMNRTDQGCDILLDGQLFAGYITDFEGSPIIYPLIGPTGKNMTRDFPMVKSEKDSQTDHPHHRSLWFTHGSVNGLDFWTADKRTQRTKYQIVHRRFVQAECNKQKAIIVTENDWLGKGNQVICRDARTVQFAVLNDQRIIDFEIIVTAEQEEVVFGDTKEGTFGIRVAEPLAADAKKGGHFVNAEGKTNGEAWGKRSAWVDYYGTIDGESVGVAILNHPSSFRFPTYWHVREYGLFAANPFGVHDFEQQKDDKHLGDFSLPKGKSFTLRYRVILHRGDHQTAGIAEVFKQY